MKQPGVRAKTNARSRHRHATDEIYADKRREKYKGWLEAGGYEKLKYAKDAYRSNPDVRAYEKEASKLYARTNKGRYKSATIKAGKRALVWEINFDDFVKLVSQPCYYCNGPLPETGSGLDRADNNRGYLLDNVVPCCKRCNSTKMDNWTVEEAKAMITLGLSMRLNKDIA